MENSVQFNDTFSFPLNEKEIVSICNALLKFLIPNKKAYLILRLVSDEEIQALNLQRRNKNSSTDVLSFPEIVLPLPEIFLGEVVISYQTMYLQAGQIGHEPIDEFLRLLVHGVLHLIGYDHETSKEDELIMQNKEDESLDFLYKKFHKSFDKLK